MKRLSRQRILWLLFLSLVAPLSSLAEILYFCSPPNPIASGPWSVDIDANGVPDLDVAVVGQNVTVLPAIGNSVLATNRSYYTNLPPFNDPVLVAAFDEVASLTKGDVVPFCNPSQPFWRERRASDWQPLTLPMTFLPGDAGSVAINYFALKLRINNSWILAWVRVRLSTGADARCAVDWGHETRDIHEVVAGSRPSPSTIRSTEKVLGIPLFPRFEDTGVDLDVDGTIDISFGGWALTTFGGGGTVIGGGPVPMSSGILSYGAEMTGQNEFLRDTQSIWILQTGGGIADFVPSGTSWLGGYAGLVSTGLGTNATWTGHLAETTNGFMGVRLYKNDEFFYGWIHLQLSNQQIDGSYGPSILGWAIETRPQVPIVAGARGAAGEAVLDPPALIGNLMTVNVTGLSRSNVTLAASDDLIHWTPLITNSIPFKFVYPTSSPGNARYFRAIVEH